MVGLGDSQLHLGMGPATNDPFPITKEIRLMKRIVVVHALLLILLVQTSWPQEKKPTNSSSPSLTTIIIVRHAEKDTMKTDPPLTSEGRERAGRLAQMLRSSGITAIYATQYIRTQQTVQPIAESLHLKPQILTVNPDNIEEHVTSLIKKIRNEQAGKVVLIASHGNVIPLLLRDIGVKDEITIGDGEYNNLFIVTITIDRKMNLFRLRY